MLHRASRRDDDGRRFRRTTWYSRDPAAPERSWFANRVIAHQLGVASPVAGLSAVPASDAAKTGWAAGAGFPAPDTQSPVSSHIAGWFGNRIRRIADISPSPYRHTVNSTTVIREPTMRKFKQIG